VYIFGGCFFRLRRYGDDPADAVEWASHNIRLNAVAPCYYDTNPNRECFVNDPVLYDTILVQIPLHKLGNLDELSRLILHLASPDLDYMTGSTITIDGVYNLRARTRRMGQPKVCQKKGG
jgi:NAD(P)-dependent dehydrogenase (short-subunit alcohol dehydrogenase family)